MKRRLALLAAVAICAVRPAHADWDSGLQDCLSDHNKALNLRHRECFARELAKLPQHVREENGKVIRIMTETAAVKDRNDAKDEADERAGIHHTPDPLTSLVDCLSDDRFLHLRLRHHECALAEEAKLSQSVREARADTIRGVINTAAQKDENDAAEDEIERKIDNTFALLDRNMRSEQFAHDLKAARLGTGEVSAIVARYCTGRGEPRIGMTELEVQQHTTWCVPSAINDTITAGKRRRQDVFYGDRLGSGGNTGYLYYEDGKLVTIQRRN